jgi:hypothetical protein
MSNKNVTVNAELQMTWKTEALTISRYYNNIWVDALRKISGKIIGLGSRIEAVSSWIFSIRDDVPFWCLLYVAKHSGLISGQYLVRILAAVAFLYCVFSSRSSLSPVNAGKQNTTASWQVHAYQTFTTSSNSTPYNLCRRNSLIK